jgi:hypothetical protein
MEEPPLEHLPLTPQGPPLSLWRMGPSAETRPNSGARAIGVTYLLYFLVAVLGGVLVPRRLAVVREMVNLVSFAIYIAVTLLFYGLFKPVNRGVSLLAAVMSLLGSAVGILGVFHLAPPQFSPLWFFGPYCILIGWLILRSTFLPRILGALLVLAGVGWLAYLSPVVVNALSSWIKGIGILAEASLMLWLVVMGVNERRWQEQSGGKTSP